MFEEGLEVHEHLEHWGVILRSMGEDQGWQTSQHHLSPTYISPSYVPSNAASSGREEKRGSKTYMFLPPSLARFFSPSTSSFSSQFSTELYPTLIRAQRASWKIVSTN